MNAEFSESDLARLSKFVKRAGQIDPAMAAASLSGPASYEAWLGPKSILAPPKPKMPGFWASLGRSALGSVDRFGGANVRSFFGASPGPSTLRTLAEVGPHYLWSKATGDSAGAASSAAAIGQGFSAPAARARYQSAPYANALSDWSLRQHPDITRGLVMPVDTFKRWWNTPPTKQNMPPKTPRKAPWEPSDLPPIKPMPGA